MKSLFRVGVLVAALLGAGRGEVAQADWDNCQTYPTSRLVSSYEYGTYCGGTGNGCTFCWNNDGGSYCYGTPGSTCIDQKVY